MADLLDAFSTYALEVQAPYSTLITSGRKTIETRRYALPPCLIGQSVHILESAQGCAGVSALGDEICLDESPAQCAIIGCVVFSRCKIYTSMQEWEVDRNRHCVPTTTDAAIYNYSDTPGAAKIYGWVVAEASSQTPSPLAARTLSRAHRSLYRYNEPDGHLARHAPGASDD